MVMGVSLLNAQFVGQFFLKVLAGIGFYALYYGRFTMKRLF